MTSDTGADLLAAEMRDLEATLRRRFRVVKTVVDVGDRKVSILHPASAEELIDESDFERDERLPYWAELWPSARVLGTEALQMIGKSRRLLELGCGAGLVTACAAIAGFNVDASDYYDDATRFARLNAWRNGRSNVRGLPLDWRALPADLARYDVVLASDVLYERPYGALVAQVLARVLADDGTAFVADPGRVGREPFLAALPANGLIARSQREIPFVEGTIRQTIVVIEVCRSA